MNPLLRTLEVLRLSEERWVVLATFGGDDEVSAEPFEAVPLQLARIWPDLAP